MSDFRFTGRWLNDRRVMTLTGDAFKTFVTAGTWMVENRTDGFLTADDLEFIPRVSRSSIAPLVAAGLWAEVPGGWQMVDYQATQTTRSEFEALENVRRREREKKARQRAKNDGAEPAGFSPSPGDNPGDVSRGSTQARTGQEGQARTSTGSGSALTWDVAPIPGSAAAWGCSVCGDPLPCEKADRAHAAVRAA
ncbi:hypothetical protein [Ruicaihuangia caeni]|uniref:Uncharacterized protein n=1 Tax=Ruicaihuangia caeni TaxID=3042517 RepID=A0AAW6T2E0_9MICO|nr:hypothetical protein [Klugiella sp. YN-L-19]MDI2098000.1 hypothetical protein [Klugiella sp. YN-L-19]